MIDNRVHTSIAISAVLICLMISTGFVAHVSQRAAALERGSFNAVNDTDQPTSSDIVWAAVGDVEELYFPNTGPPTRAQLSELKNFPELRYLSISGPFAPDALDALKHVKDIRGIYVSLADSDAHLQYLRHCHNLQQITLMVPDDVTGSFLDSLTCTESLKELTIYHGISVEDDILPRLRRFPNLRRLRLEGCWFNGSEFHVLQEMKQLQYLSIDRPNDSVSRFVSHIPKVRFIKPQYGPNVQTR